MVAPVEVWRPVAGYETLYHVSNMGRVKALEKRVNTWNGGKKCKEQIISPIVQHSGYAHVGLWRNQKCKQVCLHRLIAEAFCPNTDPASKTQVNHINENKLDNRASNLEWVTPKENTNHGNAIAKRIKGRIRSVACFTLDGDAVKIFSSQAEANAWCGVSRYDGHISACCKGKQKTAYGFRWRYTEGGEAKCHRRRTLCKSVMVCDSKESAGLPAISYLVGTLDRFNNGKAAEERDRVKHASMTQWKGDA